MVQPNIKIYPVSFISTSVYSNIKNRIKDLAKQKKTEIEFNFEEQYFDIKGRSQQACDDTSQIIEEHLLPQLNNMIDENKFEGTFEDLEDLKSLSQSLPPSLPSTGTSTPDLRLTEGRPFNFDDIDKKAYSKMNEYDYYTDSDEPDESDDEYVETFTFAKNINSPRDVLTGPPVANNKPADYLRIIGNDTDTECSLINRQVKIVGKTEEDVKEALERFRNLQTFYKRRKRTTNYVPCVHYPSESSEFGLYFCSLERYAQQAYVDILNRSSTPLFVILPAFKNNTGNFQKPRELLDIPQPVQQQWVQQQRQQEQRQEISLDERMRLASLEYKPQQFGNLNAGLAPDLRPLWGENKTYVTNPSAQSIKATSPKPTMPPVVHKQPEDDFPALMTAPKVATPKKAPTRKVMRITSQKSASVARTPQKSFQEVIKEYNFHNIRTALEDGLTTVRGFKGDIKLSAKLGKILWSQITPDIQKQIWNFQDLKDILMKERGVRPNFNDTTTFSDDVITKISEILPAPYSRSAYFEIHAQARNQPILPYQSVTMYINQGIVEFKKIVTNTNKVTEVDWVSLERKFDFRLLLQTEQTTRSDVKPYTTFLKKVSISPVTRQITYENVPDFLEVDYILLRQTTKYRIHFPFVVEITRTEKIPLIQQKFNGYGINKILGDTGKGQVWYDLEVFYSTYDEIFKGNNDLPAGKLASWTVEDVLGTGDGEALVEYIRCLLILIEKCNRNL